MKVKIGKKKLSKKVAWISIGLLVLVIIFALQFQKPKPKEFIKNNTVEISKNLLFKFEVSRYQSDVEIIQYEENATRITVGITIDPWNLNFGIVPVGGSYGTRHVVLTNLKEDQAKASLKAYGNISPMINFARNDFVLKQYDNVTVDVVMKTTKLTTPGNYTGEIDIIIIRPKYRFLTPLLGYV